MINQTEVVNKDDTVEKIPITEKDKESFLKAVLSDKSYEDTLELLDGTLKITFKAASVEENEDLMKQFRMDEKNGLSSNDNAYFTRLVAYRMGVSLVKINGVPYLPNVTKEKVVADDKTTYVSVRADSFNAWPVFKLSSFVNIFLQFEDKIVRLGKEIRTTNFWKASV